MSGSSINRSGGVKRKKVTLTIKDKLRVIQLCESGRSTSSVAKDFNIGTSTVSDIRKQKEQYLKYISTSESEGASTSRGCGRRTLKTSKNVQLDEAVYKWFAQHRTAGVTIRAPEIKNAASRFAASLEIKDFQASDGWVARFKGRHNIVKRKIVGEKLSADTSSVEPFKHKLRTYILSNNLYSYQIYNADETGLYWRSLPDKTLAMRSEGCVPGRKVNKDRLSAMMCANADGTDRITCAIVGKSKKPRALQHCLDRLPVKYYNSKNAWFTQEIFLSWFHDVFCKEVRDHQVKKLKVRPSEVRALLLLDNAPAHPRIDTLTSHDGKITCMALPPNTTSLIQPMDQGVICATKRLYTKTMLNEVLVVLPLEEDMELGVDNRAKRTLENLKNYSIKEAIYNWAKVWSEVKELTLKNSWKKLLTSTVSNEEDEEMNFEGFTDEIHGMFRNAGENLERQDVVDWLERDANDPGYGVMSEEEILQSITGEVDEEAEDEEGSEEPTPQTTKYSLLMSSVDLLINFSSNCANPEVGNMYQYLRRTKELIIKQANEHRRQAKLDSYLVRKATKGPSTSEASQAIQVPSTSEASAAGSQN